MHRFWMLDRIPDPSGNGVSTWGTKSTIDPRDNSFQWDRIGSLRKGVPSPGYSGWSAAPVLRAFDGMPPYDGTEFEAYASYETAAKSIEAKFPERAVWIVVSEAEGEDFYRLFYQWRNNADDLDDLVLRKVKQHGSFTLEHGIAINTLADLCALMNVDVICCVERLIRRRLLATEDGLLSIP